MGKFIIEAVPKENLEEGEKNDSKKTTNWRQYT
jgi:hypothetical protein